MLGELSLAIPLAVLCVLVSAFCSGTEVALFSLRRVEREKLARSESRRDRWIVKLVERPRRLIATVLIGNEACGAVLAVVALALAVRFGPTGISPWWTAALALALALPLVVLISEVTPKTVAAKLPLGWARACVFPLAALAIVVTPVRLVITFIAELLLRPLGDAARGRPTRDLSEQEFRSLVDAGSAQGSLDARERRLIHRVFEFSDKNVGQVMTPRERIYALAYDLPMQRLVKEIAARGFSRVPIYQKSLDNIRGIVNAKDLLRAGTSSKPLVDVLHEPLFVPRTTPVKRLFLTFKQKKVHMAVVVSEYGKVLGLVTMDDLLAQIFGVIRDERAALQASMPNLRVGRIRTPIAGVETGPVARVAQEHDTGPVARHELDTGPVLKRADSEVSGPTAKPVEGLDPPIRPIHPVDEVTPPAIDIDELARVRERKS